MTFHYFFRVKKPFRSQGYRDQTFKDSNSVTIMDKLYYWLFRIKKNIFFTSTFEFKTDLLFLLSSSLIQFHINANPALRSESKIGILEGTRICWQCFKLKNQHWRHFHQNSLRIFRDPSSLPVNVLTFGKSKYTPDTIWFIPLHSINFNTVNYTPTCKRASCFL